MGIAVRVARELYLRGPALLGAWEGRPIHDVCAQMTQTSAAFWAAEAAACIDMIDRKVTAQAIGIALIALCVFAYQMTAFCGQYWVARRLLMPIIQQDAPGATRAPYIAIAGHPSGATPA